MRLFLLLVLVLKCYWSSAQIYSCVDGQVNFISDAPLEIIKASSDQMQGVFDLENKTFAFRIYIKSFEGFNNPLQREHFNENYLEVADFPIATFKGKVLEQIAKDNSNYRAKGILDIHGIEVERIIDVTLDVKEDVTKFYASFSVPLVDHDISLPRIVYQKIAEEILVVVQGDLNLRE